MIIYYCYYHDYIGAWMQCMSVHFWTDSLWEGVEAVGLLGVGEGHPHAGRERGVEDDGSALIAGSQVHWWHGANALAVHNHVLGSNAVPAAAGKHNISTSDTFPLYLYLIMQGNTVQAPQYVVHWQASKQAFKHWRDVAGSFC